jgi:hypothetical protein
MSTYVSILRIPQMIWVWKATVEWYRQGKTEELGEKPVPVPLCPPQIPHGLTQAWTRASAVTGWRLTTWAMARLIYLVCLIPQNMSPKAVSHVPTATLKLLNANLLQTHTLGYCWAFILHSMKGSQGKQFRKLKVNIQLLSQLFRYRCK